MTVVVDLQKIPELMEDVYHGAVPQSELALLTKHVERCSAKRKDLYWHDLLEAIR